MKRVWLISIVLVPILLVACGNEGSVSHSSQSFDGVSEESTEMVEVQESKSVPSADNRIQDIQDIRVDERLVAYEAELSLAVKGLDETIDKIQQVVAKEGGYIVESSVYEVGNGRKNARMVAKVPQQSFDQFLSYIESESEEVIHRNIHGQDVTEEYVDLESRLKAKKVVEERLLTFIKDATTTEDLLKISDELGKIQEEIERIEGKLKFLLNRTDYSSVTIHLEDAEIVIPSLDKGQSNTWEKAQKTFIESINGLKGLGSTILIALIGFSPVWIIGLLFIGGIWLFVKRKRKQLSKE